MSKFDIRKINSDGTINGTITEMEDKEMLAKTPEYMSNDKELVDIWIFDEKGNKSLYCSNNKDRDMSDITKDNPLIFNYSGHWRATIYCENNEMHIVYNFFNVADMQMGYNNAIDAFTNYMNQYYPAVRYRYKEIKISVAEVTFTL